MLRQPLIIACLLACSACNNFVPTPKTASVDTAEKTITMPHPCPDWSQSQTSNYLNQPHSNYGCAVTTNSTLQVADPNDLVRGHGDNRPDPEISRRVIQQYRAGDIPAPLTPLQSTGSGQ